MTKTQSLASLLDNTDGPLVVPGGGTPLEARAVENAGFEAFYLSGYAVAAWRHGLPDIGLLGASEMADALRAVTRVASLPVITDADTGYGDSTSVHANVRLLESCGAAAIQIEDQVWPKRCGHMAGKEVIEADDAVRKIATAVAARRNPDTAIIARTDALAPRGLDEAVSRARRFHEAGADVVFIDAPGSVEELAAIGSSVPGPLMANMSEGGRTPLLTAEKLDELGFRIVIYPTAALRVASCHIRQFVSDLRNDGNSSLWHSRMDELDELNELVGLANYLAIDQAFAG